MLGKFWHWSKESDEVIQAESFLKQGNKLAEAGDFKNAIACYDQALAIKPNYHLALYNKGLALSNLGDKLAAIACYDQALAIKPDNYQALYNKGLVLSNLGDKFTAIACYDQALAIKPDLHEVLCNKGVALSDLGDKIAAIACYDQALAIKLDHHLALYNKGVALSDLGDKIAAIACFDQALVIRPDYHEALCNKGVALSDVGDNIAAIAEALCNKGVALSDVGDNIAAIACYDQALAIKLDLHEALYNKGVALYALGDKLAAIECFDQALAIKPDKHEALNNKGTALSDLGEKLAATECFDQALQLKRDLWQGWIGRGSAVRGLQVTLPPSLLLIALQNRSLNQPGYEGERANYTEGRKHIDRQTQPEGWGQLHRAIGRSHYSQGKYTANPRSYYREALKSYHTALETLTEQDFPEVHLELLQDLIRVCLGLDDRAAAIECRSQGLRVLGDLLNKAPFAMKPRIEAKFSGFSQVAIDLLLQDGQIITALETADRYKNRCLTWILDEWKEQVISPSYAEMRQLLREDTAIVYWHLSPDALTTFLLLPNKSEPQVLDSDRATLLNRHKDFEAWKKDWDKQYQDYRPKKENSADKANHPWRNTLSDRLNQLRQILNLPALEQQLSGITHLILIPHRDLHRFPLHALFSNTFTCTYLPSAQIGLSLQNRSTPNLTTATLLSVEDPSGQAEMLYARIESTVIQQMFTHVTAIAPDQATPTAVTTALSQGYDLFHFTGHGEHNDRQPQNSAIGLANETQLTAKEISALPLQTCYLASIAACETAVTNRQAIDTEYVGLVSAFLRAGTAHVISTLWNVEEISSSWLMIRFYQLLSAGNAPTLAFKQTQQWFRAVTAPQLADWLKQLSQLPGLDPGIQEYLTQEAGRLTANVNPADPRPADSNPSSTIDSNQPIYAHPYYWAAFTLTGRATR